MHGILHKSGQRQSQICSSYDKLYSSWQFDKNPIISEPHHSGSINLTHVNESYNICENEQSIENVEKMQAIRTPIFISFLGYKIFSTIFRLIAIFLS